MATKLWYEQRSLTPRFKSKFTLLIFFILLQACPPSLFGGETLGITTPSASHRRTWSMVIYVAVQRYNIHSGNVSRCSVHSDIIWSEKKQYNGLLYSLHAYTMHKISWSPTLQYTWTIFIQEMYDSRKKQYNIASHWISLSHLPYTWTDCICIKAPNIEQLPIINFLSCVRTTLDPLDL